MTKHDWKRFWLHFPVGVFGAGVLWINATAGAVFCLSFLAYEIIQDWSATPAEGRSYKDIIGYCFGLGVMSAIMGVFF